MKSNLGKTDKIIRLSLAVLLIIILFTKVVSGALAITLMVVTAIAIITPMINFCPLYYVLGISSKKKD